MSSESSDDKKDARRAMLVERLAQGATLEEASAAVGVTSRCVRKWREADPEFAELVADAMCSMDDLVEGVTFKNCLDPDPSHNSLRMFWLKSRRPEVYRDKIEQSGQTKVIVEYVDGGSNPIADSEAARGPGIDPATHEAVQRGELREAVRQDGARPESPDPDGP